MSMISALHRSTQSRKRTIGLLLVSLGLSICFTRVYVARDKISTFSGVDFRALYGSCRCVLSNCNPYDSSQTKLEFFKQGGTVAEAMKPIPGGAFKPYYVGYPPPSLFYMTPFALLRWPLAMFVYMGVCIAFYVVALILFADLCSDYAPIAANACLGLFVATQGKILMLAQPTLLFAALLCIAVWCLLRNRFAWFGIASFALSLIYKPPLGALFLLYFLLASPNYRKRALQVIGLTIVLCIPALVWFSTHPAMHNWIQDYHTSLTNITAPGNLSDPGPKQKMENEIISLQTIVSLYRDEPDYYNHVVWGFSVIVLMAWLYPVVRQRNNQEKDIICLAAIAAFSMLPIYHRVYDSRALLILFPAVALLMQRTRWWGRVAASVTILMSVVLSDWYTAHSHPDSPLAHFGTNRFIHIVLVHAAPVILLGITLFYLAVLYLKPPSAASQLEAKPIALEPKHV